MTELPTTFGKYYLTEKLATGGMAEIYLAKIIGPGGFEKPVVIKQIHPKLSGNRHFVDLFVAEAKTLVTLAHGNIVPVYELGVIDDTYFIAMDYIDGPTLYRLTETMARRDAHMEPAIAAWITARMLEGLDYAHRKGDGVIHRDLSPRNVMLSRDGEVKLVDFGIAVTLGDATDADARESAPTGSFPYMSPEQVRREALGAQTDLFSVGVLLWEMLAGRRLFARGEADATLDAVLRVEIPRPSSVRAEVPAKLDDVVMRALERDRDARWQSAADMLAPLNKYLYSLDATPGPREVAAMVARYCPPETRRLPTNLEAIAHEVISPEPLADHADDKPAASGPSTAVIPRGKPKRQQSFATNVDIKAILDNATPLLPFDAIDDTPTKQERPSRPRLESDPTTIDAQPLGAQSQAQAEDDSARRANQATDDDAGQADAMASGVRRAQRVADVERADDEERAARPASPIRRRETLSRGGLVLMGLGALGLAAVAIVMFYRLRDRVLMNDPDAAIDSPPIVVEIDAAVPADAATTDTPAEPSRDVDGPRDAGVRRADGSTTARPLADAGAEPRDTSARDAATRDATTRGTATLKIGADPWGDIYVDGKPAGRTPRELTVAAGRHTIEIVFPAENPPRKQTFAVDLANGETKPLQADFTN